MKFQISINYNNQLLTYNVRQAVYFEDLVYQIFSDELNIILYQRDGLWKSNDKKIQQDLIDKLGAAITEQAGN